MIRDNPPKINKNIIKMLDIMLQVFNISVDYKVGMTTAIV
jgi:hypothetical protein